MNSLIEMMKDAISKGDEDEIMRCFVRIGERVGELENLRTPQAQSEKDEINEYLNSNIQIPDVLVATLGPANDEADDDAQPQTPNPSDPTALLEPMGPFSPTPGHLGAKPETEYHSGSGTQTVLLQKPKLPLSAIPKDKEQPKQNWNANIPYPIIMVNCEQGLKSSWPKWTEMASYQIRGQRATGKSVTRNTRVPFYVDGVLKVIPIEEAYQIEHDGKNHKLLALGMFDKTKNGNSFDYFDIRAAKTTVLRFSHEGDVLMIRTKSGREIEVTPDHSLLIYDEEWAKSHSSHNIQNGQFLHGRKHQFQVKHASEVKVGESMPLAYHVPERIAHGETTLRGVGGTYAIPLKLGHKDVRGSGLRTNGRLMLTPIGPRQMHYTTIQTSRNKATLTSNFGELNDNFTYTPRDFGFMVGLYVAEGSGQIITNRDPEIRARMKDALKRMSVPYSEHEDYISLNGGFGNWLESQSGQGSENKHVPEFIWGSPKSIKIGFIEGYLSGDGTFCDNDIGFTTKSKRLSVEFSLLLSMFGTMSALREKVVNGETYYLGHIPPHFLKHLITLYSYQGKRHIQITGNTCRTNSPRPKSEVLGEMEERHDCRYEQDMTPLTGDIMLDKIMSITRKNYRGFVYDLSVEGAETFVLENQIVVHNSSLGEAIGIRYWQAGGNIWDLFSSHLEALAWIDGPEEIRESVRFVVPESTTLDSPYDIKTISIEDAIDIANGSVRESRKIFIVCKRFYGSEALYFDALKRLSDAFALKDTWDAIDVVLVRESGNWLSARMRAGGKNERDANNEFVKWSNELLHSGYAALLDALRLVSITKEVRDVLSGTILKAQGNQVLEKERRFLYRIFTADLIRNLPIQNFVLHLANDAVFTGWYLFPYFHELRGKDILKRTQIDIKFDKKAVRAEEMKASHSDNDSRRVITAEIHEQIIQMKLNGTAVRTIAAALGLSETTIKSQVTKHRVGTNDDCSIEKDKGSLHVETGYIGDDDSEG